MILEATINPNTREVSFEIDPLSGKTDIDVTGIRFTCPNDIGINTDLFDMAIKIRTANARKELYTYFITDKTLDGENVIFTWTLNEPTSRYDGTLYFNVTAEEYSDETITKRWNTRMRAVEVFKTLDEGIFDVTPEQLTEIEALLSQLNNTVKDYNSAVRSLSAVVDQAESAATAAQQAIAQSSTLHAEGNGTVIFYGLSDSMVASDWYQEYIENADWLTGRKAVGASTDLNGYVSPGNYYVASSTVAESLSNAPDINGAFTLTVEFVTSSNEFIRQTAIATDNTFFVRHTSDEGATWTDWSQYFTSTEFSKVIDRKVENDTTYTFSAPRHSDSNGDSVFAYFILAGGSQTHYSLWFGMVTVIGTDSPGSSPVVNYTEITSNSYYTLTMQYTNENTLTITSDKTVYGGLRLIWLG